MSQLRRFLCCTRGVTSIEYAFIGGSIAVGIVGAATALGGKLSTVFQTIVTKLR